MSAAKWVCPYLIYNYEQTASVSLSEHSFFFRIRIIFLIQLVDVNTVSILDVKHKVPSLIEYLLTLTALQMNFFAT